MSSSQRVYRVKTHGDMAGYDWMVPTSVDPHISIESEGLRVNHPPKAHQSHRILTVLLFVWCAMDPINKNPLYVGINIPAPWILTGNGHVMTKSVSENSW